MGLSLQSVYKIAYLDYLGYESKTEMPTRSFKKK